MFPLGEKDTKEVKTAKDEEQQTPCSVITINTVVCLIK